MKTYEYKGFDRNGKTCRGWVEALSLKGAREKLAADGILAERILAAGRTMRLPSDARATLYRELAALLSAGIPLVRALDLLMDSAEASRFRVVLAAVRDLVREGRSLADALAEACETVTPFERAILQAGETSATVETMLERLAVFLDEQSRIRDRIQTALLYPALVAGAGVCVAFLMLGLLLPRAEALLTGGGLSVPLFTRVVVACGRVVLWAGLLGFPAAVIGGIVFFRKLKADPELQSRWDRLLLRVPVLGTGFALLVATRFCRTLAILLQGGVLLVDGFVLAGRATGNAWVAELTEKSSDTIRHGGSLSAVLAEIPPLAGSLPAWVRIGEAGGGLTNMLENAGHRYQRQWERFLERRLALLEPVLILVIGGFVLIVTLSILLPVLSLSTAVSR